MGKTLKLNGPGREDLPRAFFDSRSLEDRARLYTELEVHNIEYGKRDLPSQRLILHGLQRG